MTEDFESFSIAHGGAGGVGPGISTLDSTTVFLSQGPGLVIPGFALQGGGLQWNGNGYFGLPTRTVLMKNLSAFDSETIDFTSPVQAFGVDLLAFDGYGFTATAVIYGADDTTVLTTVNDISIFGGASIAFLGASDSGGIGKVVLGQDTWPSWAPIIDNLTFGIIPEPSTLLLTALGGLSLLGVARRQRK